MSTTKIICPQCGRSYTLRCDNMQAMANVTFRCPKCGYTTNYGQLLRRAGAQSGQMPSYNTDPLKTHLGGPSVPGGMSIPGGMNRPVTGGMNRPVPGGMNVAMDKTHVAAPSEGVTLIVADSGRRFPISNGIFTLGRMSSDSRASVKLAPDPYMSRMHARLEVSGNMGKVLCSITPLNSVNKIFVNGYPIAEGQKVTLSAGDELLLGMTKVKVNF